VHTRFIEENPGRQTMSGSFNPIDDGEWSEQVYVKPTWKLFTAIAACDRDTAQNLIREEIDINQCDHVGRTALHVAILSKALEIACDLINAGARITERLADGKAPYILHPSMTKLPLFASFWRRVLRMLKSRRLLM
jgi:ankyrin repeat protein